MIEDLEGLFYGFLGFYSGFLGATLLCFFDVLLRTFEGDEAADRCPLHHLNWVNRFALLPKLGSCHGEWRPKKWRPRQPREKKNIIRDSEAEEVAVVRNPVYSRCEILMFERPKSRDFNKWFPSGTL